MAALSVSTAFRAVVKSGVCSSDTTSNYVITVSPAVVSKAITGTSAVCTGTNTATLTLAAASVGTIQWQSSTDNTNWNNLGSAIAPTAATNAANSITVTNLTQSTWYRVVLTSGVCTSATTAAFQVVVNQQVPGTISGAAALCIPNTGTTLTLTGSIGTIVWQKSVNWTAASPTWTAITGATASTLTSTQMAALTVSTAFRAVVTSGACQSATSNFVVTINPNAASANISANITSPSGASAASALCTDGTTIKTFAIPATGYVGSIQWQTVASNVAPTSATVWTDIVGEIGLTYTVGQNGFSPVVGGNYFRVKFSTPCSVAFSTPLVVWYTANCVVRAVTPVEVVSTDVKTPFDVKAYPNPYTETFNLSLSTSSEDKVGIVVYDMTGRLIERREVRPSDMVEQQIGDRYPSGVYNIVVTQGEEVKTLRVIKR
jgi:hypothetical protein